MSKIRNPRKLFVSYIVNTTKKYQGVFKAKNRVKTRQVRGISSQQLEHKDPSCMSYVYITSSSLFHRHIRLV